MFFLPLIAGALVGAEAVEPGVVERKATQIKESITTSAPQEYVERCEIKGDVMICLQKDGSFAVTDI